MSSRHLQFHWGVHAILGLATCLCGGRPLYAETIRPESRRIVITGRSAEGCYFPNPTAGPIDALRVMPPAASQRAEMRGGVARCSTRTCLWIGCPGDLRSVDVTLEPARHLATGGPSTATDSTISVRTVLTEADRTTFWRAATTDTDRALVPRTRKRSAVEDAAYGTRRLRAARVPGDRARWDLYTYSGAYVGQSEGLGHIASGLGTRLDLPYALDTSTPSQIGVRAEAEMRRIEYGTSPVEAVIDGLSVNYSSHGVIKEVEGGRLRAPGSPVGVVDGASATLRLGGARSPVDLRIDGGLLPAGYAMAPQADVKTAGLEASYEPTPTTSPQWDAYAPWGHVAAGSRLMWAASALDPSLEWLEAHGYAGPFAMGGYLAVRSAVGSGATQKPILPEQANGWASWSFRRPIDIELSSSWLREINSPVTRMLYAERSAPGDLTRSVSKGDTLGPIFWSSDFEISGRTSGRRPIRWYTRVGHETYASDLALVGAAGIRLLGWPWRGHSFHLFTRGRWGDPWSLASGGLSDAIDLTQRVSLSPSAEIGWRARSYVSTAWMTYQAFRLGLSWDATARLTLGTDALLSTGAYGPPLGELFATLRWRLF